MNHRKANWRKDHRFSI